MAYQGKYSQAPTLDTVVYVVYSGLQGGYMPNTQSYFVTKREALSYMADERSFLVDSGYTVKGDIRRDEQITFDDHEYLNLEPCTLQGIGLDTIDFEWCPTLADVVEYLNQG